MDGEQQTANTDCTGGYAVTQFEIAWKTKPLPSSEGRLVFNGQLIEDSWVHHRENRRHEDMLSLTVYNTTASTLLMQCRLADIAEQFDDLTLPLPEALSEYFNKVDIVFRDHDGTETLQLGFDFETYVEYWAKSWSIADFASILHQRSGRPASNISFTSYSFSKTSAFELLRTCKSRHVVCCLR
jgi:hypothetical protein